MTEFCLFHDTTPPPKPNDTFPDHMHTEICANTDRQYAATPFGHEDYHIPPHRAQASARQGAAAAVAVALLYIPPAAVPPFHPPIPAVVRQ